MKIVKGTIVIGLVLFKNHSNCLGITLQNVNSIESLNFKSKRIGKNILQQPCFFAWY